ncbi:tRNA pseudouridine synthase B [Streptococcus pneumoniae]|nr:tRNA pseudouridine synthase B [Streptococcus pneumoniae]
MNGIINLKKEAGMTSHDAVFKLRKISSIAFPKLVEAEL